MGIEKEIKFHLRCDGCRGYLMYKEGWNLDNYHRISELIDSAKEAGWVSCKGKWYCPNCQEKLGIKANNED